MLIGAFIALFSSILVWVVVLRRRVAEQTEQIERSMRVERQRSRLLEEINSETPLEHLLDDICSSMDALVRCTRCTCTLLADTLGTREHSVSGKGVGLQSVYESALTDIKGRRIGTFRVDQTGPGTLSDDERSTLGVGAGLANLALNQRRLYTELNHRSTHDQLTALPNRRLCDTHLVAAVRDAAQQGTKVGVAYIDVDHFKEVNDQYGHRIGDLYLQQIAARLGSKVRAVDLLARIGGDEFLLVATALESVEDAETYRQRLQSCFETPSFWTKSGSRALRASALQSFPITAKLSMS